MMEAVRTSETSVDNHFTRQYIPEDNSEHKLRLTYAPFTAYQTHVTVVCDANCELPLSFNLDSSLLVDRSREQTFLLSIIQ
jgi:hypothetical protein